MIKILKVLADKRRSKQLFDLQPDAKSQVTVQYLDGKPIGCTKVVVSTQHNAETRTAQHVPGEQAEGEHDPEGDLAADDERDHDPSPPVSIRG